jgi:hypothetical protein
MWCVPRIKYMACLPQSHPRGRQCGCGGRHWRTLGQCDALAQHASPNHHRSHNHSSTMLRLLAAAAQHSTAPGRVHAPWHAPCAAAFSTGHAGPHSSQQHAPGLLEIRE